MEKITISKIIGVYEAQHNSKRVAFSTNEHGAKSMSGFFPETAVPKEGDVLEGDIVTKEKDGKIYTNFVLPKKSTPKPAGISDEQFLMLSRDIKAVLAGVSMINGRLDTLNDFLRWEPRNRPVRPDNIDDIVNEDEINPEDVPL